MMPRRRPGTKPAMMARAGNFSHWALAIAVCDEGCLVAVLETVLGFTVDGEEESVLLVGEVLRGLVVDFGTLAIVDEAALAFITHWLFWQLNPLGQQAPPHASNFPSKSVLCSWFVGYRAAFCCVTSQVIGAIVLQSWPVGQHTTDAALLNGIHAESDGQQKVDKTPVRLQGRWFAAPHWSADLDKKPMAWAASMAAVSAAAVGKVEEIRHTAVNFKRVVVTIGDTGVVDENKDEVETWYIVTVITMDRERKNWGLGLQPKEQRRFLKALDQSHRGNNAKTSLAMHQKRKIEMIGSRLWRKRESKSSPDVGLYQGRDIPYSFWKCTERSR
jgi:hypothetical protein